MLTNRGLPIDYRQRIVRDPKIMAGKPVIKGTRVPVERVLAHLADTPHVEDVFAAFPHLTIEDVQACLAYARDEVEKVGSRPAEHEQSETHAAGT